MTIFHVPEDKKVTYLLHYIETGAFNMISSKLSPFNPYKQKYADLTAKLEDYNAQAVLKIVEIYRFQQRKEMKRESIQ